MLILLPFVVMIGVLNRSWRGDMEGKWSGTTHAGISRIEELSCCAVLHVRMLLLLFVGNFFLICFLDECTNNIEQKHSCVASVIYHYPPMLLAPVLWPYLVWVQLERELEAQICDAKPGLLLQIWPGRWKKSRVSHSVAFEDPVHSSLCFQNKHLALAESKPHHHNSCPHT